MSAIITEWTNTSANAQEAAATLKTKLQALWTWDSVVDDTPTLSNTVYAYYGSSDSSSGSIIGLNSSSYTNYRTTYTYGNVTVQTMWTTYSTDNLGLRIGSNGSYSVWFLVRTYRFNFTSVKRNDGFCIMLGRAKASTETSENYQPFYFGLAPTTNAVSGTTSDGAFLVMPFNYASSWGVYDYASYIMSQNSTSNLHQSYTKQYNHVGTLTAHPLYGQGTDDVIDDYLYLERIPDQLFSYVGKVIFNNVTYYRLGELLVPYED